MDRKDFSAPGVCREAFQAEAKRRGMSVEDLMAELARSATRRARTPAIV
ncbi:MAG: hypothetical protein WAN46_05325 [Gammaproteobacteria bacterium]